LALRERISLAGALLASPAGAVGQGRPVGAHGARARRVYRVTGLLERLNQPVSGPDSARRQAWQHFCSFFVLMHRVSVKCAKMERPVNSHHRFVFGEAQRIVRRTEFQIDASRRLIPQIEGLLRHFDRGVTELNRAIESEQIRTRIDDPNHFAYSTAAKEMIRRRSNLIHSIDRLKRQLADAKTTMQSVSSSLPAAATAEAGSRPQ
jgi:flagellar protein FliJ